MAPLMPFQFYGRRQTVLPALSAKRGYFSRRAIQYRLRAADHDDCPGMRSGVGDFGTRWVTPPAHQSSEQTDLQLVQSLRCRNAPESRCEGHFWLCLRRFRVNGYECHGAIKAPIAVKGDASFHYAAS